MVGTGGSTALYPSAAWAGGGAGSSRVHSTRIIRRSPEQQQQQPPGYQQPPRFQQQRRPQSDPPATTTRSNEMTRKGTEQCVLRSGRPTLGVGTAAAQQHLIWPSAAAGALDNSWPQQGNRSVAPPPGFASQLSNYAAAHYSCMPPQRPTGERQELRPPNQRPAENSLARQEAAARWANRHVAGQPAQAWKSQQEMRQHALSKQGEIYRYLQNDLPTAVRHESTKIKQECPPLSREELAQEAAKKQDEAARRRMAQAAAESQYTVQAEILSWLRASWAETAKQLAESSMVWPHKVVYYQPA
jgi:hypothetical protein